MKDIWDDQNPFYSWLSSQTELSLEKSLGKKRKDELQHHCDWAPEMQSGYRKVATITFGALWQSGSVQDTQKPTWSLQRKKNAWKTETKIELFCLNSRQYLSRKPGTAHHLFNTVSTVRHDGGNFMLWGCFLTCRNRMTDCNWGKDACGQVQGYPGSKPSPDCSGLSRKLIFQQNNDPRHTAKITKKKLNNNSVTVLESPTRTLT